MGFLLRSQLPVAATTSAILLLAVFHFATDSRAPERSGELLARRTADVAVFLWWIASVLFALGRRSNARWWWVCACAAYVVHVGVAFDRVHNWSHNAAFEHVESVSGFGGGIFVSYGFSLIWMLDAIWCVAFPVTHESRPCWLNCAIQGFLAFMVFNGTVVYETGWIRYAGILAFAILAVLYVRGARRQDE